MESQPASSPRRNFLANAVWAMDFMRGTLCGGRRFRMLYILDEGVRGAIEPARFPGASKNYGPSSLS